MDDRRAVGDGPAGDEATERAMQRLVHRTLLLGLSLGALLLSAGLAWTLASRDGPSPPGAAPGPPPSPAASSRATPRSEPARVLLDLGLLVLMATPVCRVAVLGIGWAMAGDRRSAAVALTVLALLGLSIALGVG